MMVTIYLSVLFLFLYLAVWLIYRILFLCDQRRMNQESRPGGRVIARLDELQPGGVKKFWLICHKYRVEAFLINHSGSYHAYVNRCRHMTTPLDFVRDQFFSGDGQYLMCYTHGALYEPATGLCVAGPCKGQSLYPLRVQVDRDEILVGCPTGDLSFLAE